MLNATNLINLIAAICLLTSCSIKINSVMPKATTSASSDSTTTVDTTAPTVSSVVVTNADGGYVTGNTITVQVAFSESVVVDTTGGTPYITLEMGATDRNAVYVSGTGTTVLTFTYVLVSGDTNVDLDYQSTTALSENLGTIKDAAGNAATLTLAAMGAAGSISDNQAVVICAGATSYSLMGAGTSTTDPYLICTGEQLANIGATSAAWTKHYKQIANIDMTGFESTMAQPTANGAFIPIGGQCGTAVGVPTYFTGSYDGGDYDISNFTYTDTTASSGVGTVQEGLFGCVQGATLKNIHLVDAHLTTSFADAGVLAGYIILTKVENCSATNLLNENALDVPRSIGGLIGTAIRNSLIVRSWTTGTVRYTGAAFGGVQSDLGGLIGHMADSYVVRSYSSATVTGTSFTGSGGVGGLVGSANVFDNEWSSGGVFESYATGNVTSAASGTGGLVGEAQGALMFANSYATGNVTASNAQGSGSKVGGLIGDFWNANYGHTINCFSTGAVSGYDTVGGLIGNNEGDIINSFSTSDINGNSTANIGRLVGTDVGGTANTNNYVYSGSTFSNCSGTCNAYVTNSHADIAFFKTPTNAPMSSWDFSNSTDSLKSDSWTSVANQFPHLWYEIESTVTFPFSSGSGTSTDPFLISSLTSFNLIAGNSRWMDKHFKITANIDLTPGWTPIGDHYMIFYGSLDGDGFTLSGLSENSPTIDNIGLISIMVHASLQDLTITGGALTGYVNVGGAVGLAESSTVSNVNVTMTSVSGYLNIGGLVGSSMLSNIDDSVASAAVSVTFGVAGGLAGLFQGPWAAAEVYHIDSSHSSGTVTCTGSGYCGGLVGSAQANFTTDVLISNSYSQSDVNGAGRVGGLVGKTSSVSFDSSYAEGDVVSTASYAGGLVGEHFGTSVTSSHATGNVTGTDWVGGLMGENSSVVTTSYATGNVTGTLTKVGGLIGNVSATLSSVTDSYATGDVQGGQYSGGLIGYSRVYVTGCYATGDVTGANSTGGLIGGASFMFNTPVITESYATGNVVGTTYVGGLVGGTTDAVTNSYARGTVTGTQYVGGLVGQTTKNITNSYATGAVSGTAGYVGGLLGWVNTAGATISQCFSTSSVNGNNTSYISRLIGRRQAGTSTNNYRHTTSTFLNCAGNCNGDAQSGQNNVSDFYQDANAPFAGFWDFSTIWVENAADYPTL